MKSILIIALSTCWLGGIAQSPELFRGGIADGYVKGLYQQSSVAIWRGGVGDGHTARNYSTASVSTLWLGGSGDGYAKNNYVQPSIAFWLGGRGDGHARSNYVQPSLSFWSGGSGDGWARNTYAQPSVAFWTGGGGDGWASSYIPSRALPVLLGSFTAIKKTDASALLQWHTLSEANSSHFDIERSADAVHFTALAATKSKGNANSRTDYDYTDSRVLKGTNYYRLKQVDKDGKFVYTPTRLLVFDVANATAIRLYPNPANANVTIELPTALQNAQTVINLVDTKGNVVRQWKTNTNGQAKMPLSLQGLPKGSYLVHISAGANSAAQKLIVQ